MGRIILYLIGAAGVVFVIGVGYLMYITQKSVVPENAEETNYDETGLVVNGFAILTKRHPNDLWGNGQNRYGFVDARCNRITFVKYQSVRNFDEGGLAFVRGTNGLCGFIDTTGREIIPLIYANAAAFIDGLCLVQKGQKGVFAVGFIDRQGREAGPFTYTKFGDLGGHYYAVGRGPINQEKWGYVDTKGREVIPLQFDEASPFRDGYAVVGKLDPERHLMFRGLIDSTGRVVFPFLYTGIGPYDPQTGLWDIIKPYEENGQWHSMKGRANSRHEFVEPLTKIPD
ncbi:WG repeat-containing protein [Spirosoma montaniterrae]|uniref:WG repeat-containing protein n=1 Tax=Spirosoma montaniterrae TaxID=1178516 RepID=A0A1P9X0F8_9BACT|nr:WG repeat-containing protein [Spirosoma montaniterrae]AQG81121.1 hypothetical protein AWR27_18410 [Spirosoma montaniterrae]